MTGFSEGLGTFVTGLSFWAAVAMLGVSGLLALSRASRGAGIVFGGLIGAVVVALAPSLMATSSEVASGITGGEDRGKHPSVVEYFATLSADGRWIAGVVLAVWVAALVRTIVVALSRQDSTAD